ncbi:MAG: NADH:ubiquinone oxidoreductase [Pseudomonadota bacterium]
MKPRIGVFEFTGCGGDQLQIINLEEELLDLLGQIEIVSWREAMKESQGDYDIAFVEGSIARKSDEERLKTIRENARILVALGSCATIGGINRLKDFHDPKFVTRMVYDRQAHCYETCPAGPLSAVVPVDASIHGCPVHKDEFLRVTMALLQGLKPFVPDYPVCADCKAAGNVCVLLKGGFCLGPATRAGCSACCVTEGAYCWGCRGLVGDANVDALYELLGRTGLSAGEVRRRIRLYNGNQ